ncbi:MAG: class I SAM-dependent methyltransferase, partial [Chloroflexota bacterium]
MPAHSNRPRSAARKPQGRPTRGKTAVNRLRQVDHFVLRYDPGLLTRWDGAYAGALVVDLGYGAEAVTTLEMGERFHRLNPRLPVLGVEIDPERVAAAQPFATPQIFFRLGGFNLPLLPGEQ